MTINLSDNNPRVSYAVAQGATQTSFTVSFEFFDNDDLNVYVDGTLKTITTHYTVSGGSGSTGTVTMSVTGATGGSTVVITRDIDLDRTTDFPSSGPFNIGSLNTELDRIIAITADLEDLASRGVQLADYDTQASLTLPLAADRINKVLAFNSAGSALVTQELGTFKGNWAASTAYVERDLVKDTTTNDVFIVNAAHTSSGSLPLTTNTNSSKYDKIIDVSSPAGDLTVGDDLTLASDAAVLGFGADTDVTLTHVADTGLLLNSTRQLQFNDASQYINAPNATTLDINATDEIELNATLIDVNGNLEVSGTITLGSGAVISEAELEALDDVTAGTVAASKAVIVDSNKDISSFRNLTASGTMTYGSLSDGSITITAFVDEDNMSSNSATLVPTQQSVKAYVDAQVATADSLSEVLGNGNTTSGTNIQLTTTDELQFRDTALKISSSADGQLDIDADTEVEITAPTVDINASTEVNISGDFTVDTNTLHVDSANNRVGIANLSPSTALDVTGTVTATGGAFTGNVTFGDNNKAIFGTSSNLEIYGNGGYSYIDEVGANNLNIRTNGANIGIYDTANSQYMAQFTTGGGVELHHNGTQKFTTTATGIDINGTVGATGLNVYSGTIRLDGNYPIGTGNVALGDQALDDGSLSGNYNTAVGSNALTSNTSGGYNTGLGVSALYTNTTGASNIGVGYGSLLLNTTGGSNIAIGVEALRSNTTAAQNTAVGYQASYSNTTGYNSVAVGRKALYANTTGIENTALGWNALTASTTGRSNTAVGLQALTANTTADYTTAVGYQAGYTNTTGTITAIGASSLRGNTTGVENTGMGNATLYTNTTGGYNTAVGRQALFLNTTASNNTAVGYQAAYSNTTGANNVAIGRSSLLTNTTASENTAVGYASLYTNSTGTGNTSLGKDTLFDNTTGAYNTAIGLEALANNTTAYYNTAVGYQAGLANTTGQYNVGVGGKALHANTTGTYNTALGYEALDKNTTSASSTAIGAQALYNNTAADSTAVGAYALYNNTTGARNAAFGRSTLTTNTTGSYNTGFGNLALVYSQTASNNTAVGYTAQYNTTTGANNTTVGYQAGYAITTGSDNVLLGYNTGDALTVGGSNIAVGLNALTADTKGFNSVAIGQRALETQNFTSNTDSYNVAVGSLAGRYITTGTSNTFIGGLSGDAATTGSGNTAVGMTSMSNGTITGNYNTAVGQSAGFDLTSGGNNLFLGTDAGRAGSPGGSCTNGSGSIYLGDENIGDAYIQVDWTVASDQRDKTDFTALDLGLDFVKALAPVTYKWDKRSKYGDKTADDYDLNAQTPDGTHKEDWLDVGFKAQEVQALEEAAGYTASAKKNLTVSMSNDGKQLGLQYSKFVPILVKALQELSAKNDALEARITALEGG